MFGNISLRCAENGPMQRFKELKVWQRSHRFVLLAYQATADFPVEERFGLTVELRRSVRSVPSNIAEGAKRISRREYARFINIAEASLSEASYQILLARDLGYMSGAREVFLNQEADEIARMLNSLRETIAAAI